MIVYNGFKPGETRASKHRVRKSDNGHSIVETSTTRRGDSFTMIYAVTCQCGKRYTSRTLPGRAWRSHTDHQAKENQ